MLSPPGWKPRLYGRQGCPPLQVSWKAATILQPRIGGMNRKRRQAGRTPNASRGSGTLKRRGSVWSAWNLLPLFRSGLWVVPRILPSQFRRAGSPGSTPGKDARRYRLRSEGINMSRIGVITRCASIALPFGIETHFRGWQLFIHVSSGSRS